MYGADIYYDTEYLGWSLSVYVFTSSGMFSPSVPLDARIIVIGGGGSGGTYGGGGGGGGGVADRAVLLQPGIYPVSVGAGAGTGNSGGESSFNGASYMRATGGESGASGGGGALGGVSGAGYVDGVVSVPAKTTRSKPASNNYGSGGCSVTANVIMSANGAEGYLVPELGIKYAAGGGGSANNSTEITPGGANGGGYGSLDYRTVNAPTNYGSGGGGIWYGPNPGKNASGLGANGAVIILAYAATNLDIDIQSGIVADAFNVAVCRAHDLSLFKTLRLGAGINHVTLPNRPMIVTVAPYIGDTWQLAQPYVAGDLVMPLDTVAKPYYYTAALSGTSGNTEPNWPATPGQTVTDGTVTWECVERMVQPITQGPLIPS
ncbi:glycine-rich domain-containing protein [Methylomonas sp. HYX-M1]|uniref:glycine-rich domain-containing protein n=1 Tax=Methylomonas sp. HYX-M1 TaxID=3139307 RepID=UPI00345B7020